MLTATWWMAWFPLGIIYSFIVGHIPALDEYLADRCDSRLIFTVLRLFLRPFWHCTATVCGTVLRPFLK